MFGLKGFRGIFAAAAVISGLVNILLVFHITNGWDEGSDPAMVMVKQNRGNKFTIEVYSENDIVSNAVQAEGWETAKIEALVSHFQEYSTSNGIPLSNLTFIDIGANIGWLSFNMAALGVNVLAFEPMESNIKLFKNTLRLKKNIESGISSRITLYEHGLGTKDETCFVYSDNENIGDGHIQCVEQESDLKMKANYSVRGRVPLKRLDDVVNTEGMHIVAVKMDTEGYEGSILEGGAQVLLHGGIEKIITEFQPEVIIEKGGDPVGFMKTVMNAGYKVQRDDRWRHRVQNDYYLNDTEIVDMNFVSIASFVSSRTVTIHSPNQQIVTLAEWSTWNNQTEYSSLDEDFSDYELNGGNHEERNHQNEFEISDENGSIYAHTTNGGEPFSIEVYEANDIVSDEIKFNLGSWEYDTIRNLNENFKEYSKNYRIPLSNLTFIDIGANIGWLSFNMAALGVNVLAFEPMESNIKLFKNTLRLKKNIESGISSRITLYEHGLGTKDETCFVYSDNENIGDGHIQCVEQESDLKMKANYSVRGRVPLKRLDDVVNTEGMHIVAVKMDTEGYEGSILEGGAQVLLHGGIEKIITEFQPEVIIEKGGDPVGFMKKITEAGYRVPKKSWGYMKKLDMLNMTYFGSEDVTFHSPKLVDGFVNG